MTTYYTGRNATLTVQWRVYPGGPGVDVSAQTITVSPVGGGVPVVGPTGTGITHEGTGLYSYVWAVPAGTAPDDYVVLWTATDPDGDPVQTSEIVTVAYVPVGDGPCDWAVDPVELGVCADWATYTGTVRDAALHLATLYLWAATGRRYGVCPVTVRPEQDQCVDPAYREYVVRPGVTTQGAWGESGSLGTAGCGCGRSCCLGECSVVLAGPVYSVTEVIVDGVVIPSTAYRVDVVRGAYRLVRIDGECWPACQDPAADEDDPGAFVVTYEIGTPVPVALQAAAAVLACEYASALTGGACRLPAKMTRLSRQGVDVEIDPAPAGEGTGIREVDMVVEVLNPGRLRGLPRVLSPDLEPCDRRTIVYPGGS